MTEDTESNPADETVGTEFGHEDQDLSNNGKRKIPATSDEPPQQHTGSKNCEDEQGHLERFVAQTNTVQEAGQSGNEPSAQNKETDAMVEDLEKQLQDTKDELAAATKRASVVASELKKTGENLSKALQRAEDSEKEGSRLKQELNTSVGKTNDAESKLKKSEKELTHAQTALTKSTNESQEALEKLAAAKKRAREAEFKLKKTEEDCIRETTRANNAESEVQYLLSKIEEWEAWEKKQQQQVQESFKNSRNAEAVVANLEKKLQETQEKLDAAKTKRKTEANLEKKLQDTQGKLNAYKEKTSVAEFHLGKTKKELLEALQKAKDAENERAGLFQMLNGATIQRDNRSPPGSFPDGDQITKMATKAAIFAWEYLMDMSDFLDSDPLHAAESGLWRAVDLAEDEAEARVVKKTEHLAEFTEGEIPPEESLGHLFWKQTMQHVMKTKLDEPYDSFFAESAHGDEQLKAIVDMDEKHEDELEGRNIGTFMELHFKLRLACRFSDPECFLWPAVGTTVPFSSKHHNQQKTPDKRKRKAKAGESVLVVYPGLYFRNPEEPDCEPVVRAMVAVL